MSKIQSQAGKSLADIYDVKGSRIDIDELIANDVTLFHEMGQTIFSENFSLRLLRLSSGAINENTTFDIIAETRPGPIRILNVQVLTPDDPADLDFAAVMIRDNVNNREIPIWATEGTTSTVVRMTDEGAVGNRFVYEPVLSLLGSPTMLSGDSQPQPISQLAFRGASGGFGAGTVTYVALILIAFAGVAGGGVAAVGLPIPSW